MIQGKQPDRVRIEWCPRCGRNDRYTAFTGKGHNCYIGGSHATRTPHEYLKSTTYVPDTQEDA